MLFISYANISPSFILILSSTQEKQQKKKHFLICNNVYDDIINFEVCGFMENTKI